MKFKNISAAERSEISILRSKGYSVRSIAKSLNRSPNTISYEIRKNTVRGKYDSKKAHAKSRLRKKMRLFLDPECQPHLRSRRKEKVDW